MYERRTSEGQLSRFEDERRVWHEEKEKVKISHFLSSVSFSLTDVEIYIPL